jgi:hypothetical protein
MRNRSRKRQDFSQLAKSIVDQATGQDVPDAETLAEAIDSGKNPAAVALGRLGGLKGGKARWKGTTKKERSEITRKAALVRWRKAKRSKKKHGS